MSLVGDVPMRSTGPTPVHLRLRRLDSGSVPLHRSDVLDVTVAAPDGAAVPAKLTGRFVLLDGLVYLVLEDSLQPTLPEGHRLEPGERCARMRLERQE